jgi:hypothetical protein
MRDRDADRATRLAQNLARGIWKFSLWSEVSRGLSVLSAPQ